MEIDTSGLIDNRNLELWNFLRSVHDIEIRKENRPDYLAFLKGGKTIISVPSNNPNPAFFTHELLHIYMRSKQVFIGGGLAVSIKGSRILSQIFSDNLIEHIGNCLDHIKMLPEFIRLGYNQNEFLSDYSEYKLTKNDLANIKKHFSTNILFKKVYNAKTVDFFVGKYFAAKACPNNSFSYEERLNELKGVDFELFQILEAFLTEWNNFDYNDTNSITGSYHLFLFNFILNLEKWTKGKKIK